MSDGLVRGQRNKSCSISFLSLTRLVPKNNFSAEKLFFGTNLVRLRNEMLQLLFLCPRTNPSDKPGFSKKTYFFRLYYFSALLFETQKSPALQKKIRLYMALFFFRVPLVKSANSTSLPRLSSLQIVQMQAIQN